MNFNENLVKNSPFQVRFTKMLSEKFKDLFKTSYVVFDGGVATELYERGFYINRPFEELFGVTHPRDVAGVHEAYVDAGAMVVTTNTFSLTTPTTWKNFDIKRQQAELLQAGIKIAYDAVHHRGAKVALTFGPMGALIEPLGELRAKKSDRNTKA